MFSPSFVPLEHCALSTLDALEEVQHRSTAPPQRLTGIPSIDALVGKAAACSEFVVVDVDTPATATSFAALCSINLAQAAPTTAGEAANVLFVSMRLAQFGLTQLLGRLYSRSRCAELAEPLRDQLLALRELPISVLDEAAGSGHDLVESLMKTHVLRHGQPSAIIIDGPERLDWYQVWNRRSPGLSPVLTDVSNAFGQSTVAFTAGIGSPQELVLRQAVLDQATIVLRLLPLPVTNRGVPGGLVFELVRHRELPRQLVVVGPQELPPDLIVAGGSG
jgi:hypothetical protein